MYYKYGEVLKVGSFEMGAGLDGMGVNDDLALIKINNDDPVLSMGDVETDIEFIPTPIILSTNTPKENDGAFTIGHPALDIISIGYWIPTMGWFDRTNVDANEYIFEIPTFTGNSGGPILNLDGELVGVVWGTSISVFSDEEGNEIEWGFPFNNMHLNEIYQTEIIDWNNLGWLLYDAGALDTFAEKSTTLIEFLEDTPCNIETSSSVPIEFSNEEVTEEEIEHVSKLFDTVKRSVVSIQAWDY